MSRPTHHHYPPNLIDGDRLPDGTPWPGAQPVEPAPRVCDGCTGEYPDGDPGVIHKHYGEHCACGWFGPSWQAHRPTCEREALAQVLYGHRQATGDFPDGHTEWADLPESWRGEWREAADAVITAGFRRSRPEATR